MKQAKPLIFQHETETQSQQALDFGQQALDFEENLLSDRKQFRTKQTTFAFPTFTISKQISLNHEKQPLLCNDFDLQVFASALTIRLYACRRSVGTTAYMFLPHLAFPRKDCQRIIFPPQCLWGGYIRRNGKKCPPAICAFFVVQGEQHKHT